MLSLTEQFCCQNVHMNLAIFFIVASLSVSTTRNIVEHLFAQIPHQYGLPSVLRFILCDLTFITYYMLLQVYNRFDFFYLIPYFRSII